MSELASGLDEPPDQLRCATVIATQAIVADAATLLALVGDPACRWRIATA